MVDIRGGDTAVPNPLRGLSPGAAEAALDFADLAIEYLPSVYSPLFPEGTVAFCNPGEGTSLPPGSIVQVALQTGFSTIGNMGMVWGVSALFAHARTRSFVGSVAYQWTPGAQIQLQRYNQHTVLGSISWSMAPASIFSFVPATSMSVLLSRVTFDFISVRYSVGNNAPVYDLFRV